MRFEPLKTFMDTLVQTRSPGAVVCVYQGGKEVYRYACGYSNLEKGIPMTGEETFHIYSCTKVATVTAAMKLVEQGKLSLDAPLSDYIPEYANVPVRMPDGSVKPASDPIRIRHLFNMTAGFHYNLNFPALEPLRRDGVKLDTCNVIRALAQEPLCFEPGTHWQYSLCHDVLAAVIEIVSGMRFSAYLREAIFEPLKMDQTYFHPTPSQKEGMSEQYSFVPKGETSEFDVVEAQKYGSEENGTLVNVGKNNYLVVGAEYDSGGAGIVSTAQDYCKLLAMLAGFGIRADGVKILERDSVEQLRRNTLSDALLKEFNWPQLAGYGYGLGVRTMMDPAATPFTAKVGEFGWCGAAGACALCDPERELAVCFLQHMLNPREDYYMPRLREAIYACL
jgi:CubicO group peptidase (beta-lactamase class C family)